MASNPNDTKDVDSKGKDKIERYKWTMTNEPGELQWIDKKYLNVDLDYQRDPNSNKIMELAKAWNWIACGVIIVGKRNNKYWAIDGQHRVIAAKKRSDIKELPCIVFKSSNQVEEARGFVASNSNRKPVMAIDKFRALLVAKDENALFVKETLDKAKISVSKRAIKTHEVKCVALLQTLAASNRDNFVITINFASRFCNGFVPISDRILKGLSYIDLHVDNGLKNKRLTDRLNIIGPIKIVAQIDKAVNYMGKTGARVFARGILDGANIGLAEKYKFRFIKDNEEYDDEE